MLTSLPLNQATTAGHPPPRSHQSQVATSLTSAAEPAESRHHRCSSTSRTQVSARTSPARAPPRRLAGRFLTPEKFSKHPLLAVSSTAICHPSRKPVTFLTNASLLPALCQFRFSSPATTETTPRATSDPCPLGSPISHHRHNSMKTSKIPQARSLCVLSLCAKKTQIFPSPITPPANHYLSQPNSNSLPTTLQEYINSDSPSLGLKIHSHILKTGYEPNTNITIKLLILHLKSGCLRYARQLLDEMCAPTLSAYNYLLNAYVKHGKLEEAFDLVRKMCNSCEKPDSFTHSLILKAWASLPSSLVKVDLGRQVHVQSLKYDGEEDIVLFASLINSYVKSGRLDYARRVFHLMSVKNAICSTSLIFGYLNAGRVEDAEVLFKEIADKDVVVFNAMIEGYSKSIGTAKKSIFIYIDMRRLNFLPTVSTFVSLIGACSLLTALEIGHQVQNHLLKTQYFADIKVGSALIDMYSKCGKIDDARLIFDYMPEKNIFSWTSMIDGYGKNGNSNEVIKLFNKMQKQHHIKPNFVTFLCAISACAYSGLVEKGWEIFKSMEIDYSLKPRMEHYACMVDLLGRSGRIKEAWEFVMKMPESPNSDVWAALLSSGKLYGEVEIASLSAHELFKLCIDGRPGSYVALSNALAAAGMWESVNEVRELMKVRGISKDTGFSSTGADDAL